MESVINLTATKLSEYGALGVLVIILVVAIVILYRQNLKLYADNLAVHEKRVEDAKQFASEHASAVAKLEATSENLHELFSVMKDFVKQDRD